MQDDLGNPESIVKNVPVLEAVVGEFISLSSVNQSSLDSSLFL